MAVLSGLRGLLTRDENAVYYVSEALEQAGQTEVAVQWLTALDMALERHNAVAGLRGSQTYQEAAVIAFALAQVRHRLRRELDLPHDEHDVLADRLRDAADDIIAGDEDTDSVLLWPREQFTALVGRWPALADVFGGAWDEYRVRAEQALHALSGTGQPRSRLLAGDVADLVSYLAQVGGDPTDPEVMQGYLDHLEDSVEVGQQWPPQRNQPWCRSGLKYKRCCLPRSRG